MLCEWSPSLGFLKQNNASSNKTEPSLNLSLSHVPLSLPLFTRMAILGIPICTSAEATTALDRSPPLPTNIPPTPSRWIKEGRQKETRLEEDDEDMPRLSTCRGICHDAFIRFVLFWGVYFSYIWELGHFNHVLQYGIGNQKRCLTLVKIKKIFFSLIFVAFLLQQRRLDGILSCLAVFSH